VNARLRRCLHFEADIVGHDPTERHNSDTVAAGIIFVVIAAVAGRS